MKRIFKTTSLLILLITLSVLSCRNEESEFIETPADETLSAASPLASLIRNTTLNDGSVDNIIDGANCLEIEFPFTVIVNGIEIVINSEDDFDTVEDIIDEFEDDIDSIEIEYPITIILSDFTEILVNSEDELEDLADDCLGDNVEDDDIECIDFQYPINASVFNTNNELIQSLTFLNDEQFFDFIDDIDENDLVVLDLPITVIFFDGTTQSINSLAELQAVIENAEDDCDEDDDNDFDDDDCDSCSVDSLTDILTGCTEWEVDKLERNDNDLEDLYVGYAFMFMADGTISVDTGTNIYPGTWSASGTANNIQVTIDIPALPDCSDVWNLHEIDDEPGEYQVDLRLGDDRLRFESDCDSGGTVDDSALVAALTSGDWYITYFFDDTDETSNFADYVFNFNTDGTALATDSGGSTNGSWSTGNGDETPLELNLNFGQTIPLDELADDWDVLEVTSDRIRLKDISGGDGSEDFLTFETTPGGGGGNDIDDFLTDGTWFVSSYTEDSDDQTADYAGYELTFNVNGTVVADNGSNTINGTWMSMNSGNNMALMFDSLPFSELNDEDWDVLSASDTEVTLQDVSGGGGGTDTLTLQKL